MRKTIFFTGANGFLGKRILKYYLPEDMDIFLLMQEKFAPAMRGFLDEQEASGGLRAQVRMVPGDITKPGLGLSERDGGELRERVTEAFHLAAAYRINLPKDIGFAVNVDGTRNVLDFIGKMPGLRRLVYMSTTSIFGDHRGFFGETDFDVGQNFTNHYTKTKFEAEKLVRERMDSIPATILRPTIVVGDSRTGEIEKIDGPYYGFVMVSRRMHLMLPRSGGVKCNIEPVDFLTSAFHAIVAREDSIGKTVHIADPSPITYDEFFDLVIEKWGTFRPILRVPGSVMRYAFYLPFLSWVTGVPRESFVYTVTPIEFGCEVMLKMLEGTGISCPPVSDYIDVMIKYFREKLDRHAVKRARW
ncbi:MAG: SDR family oxidoreductase [bacterium]